MKRARKTGPLCVLVRKAHHAAGAVRFCPSRGLGPESDIDVLVEFPAGHVPGLKFVSIERELSGLLYGRRVDMVTSTFLNPRIRDEVLDSAEPLYVAA